MTDTDSHNPRQKRESRRVQLKRPPERLYYSIAEVGEMVKVKPYVLRFWEKEFPALRPKKNRAGNRIYQKKDIELVKEIRDLLYKEGYTILGARHRLKGRRLREGAESATESTDNALDDRTRRDLQEEIGRIRREVEELLELFC